MGILGGSVLEKQKIRCRQQLKSVNTELDLQGFPTQALVAVPQLICQVYAEHGVEDLADKCHLLAGRGSAGRW